ncbi:hypothetical protein TorRG33x02_135510, partial [Trema orientale]
TDLLFFEFWPPLTLRSISEASYLSLSTSISLLPQWLVENPSS